MRKTQNAERDEGILADYESDIRTKDLMEKHGLSRASIYTIIREQHRIKYYGQAPHQATAENLRMSQGEWEKERE